MQNSNHTFLNSIQLGLAKFKHRLNQKLSHLTKSQLNQKLIVACEEGNLESVKYLLTSSQLRKHADLHLEHDKPLITAAEAGHLDIVKYIMDNSTQMGAMDIYGRILGGVFRASIEGHLDIVKYLVTHPQVHTEGITANEHLIIVLNIYSTAAGWGQLAVLDYILTSPELINHNLPLAAFHSGDDFKDICKKGYRDMVEYIIFDYRLELNPEIKEYLTDSNNDNQLGNDTVMKMFQSRDNYDKMNQTLTHKSLGIPSRKKTKI